MKDFRQPKLLIVDDKQENTELITKLLHPLDFEVLQATSCKQTLDLCEQIEFELILLDVRMPVNSFETCHKIKTSKKNQETPVIFLAEKTDFENISEAFKHSCRDIILKPFQVEELLSKVTIHALIQQQQKQLRQLIETRDQIYSLIAHDLRNPFNALIGLSDLILKDLDDSDPHKQNVKLINGISNQTLNLLDELLSYSRNIQTGQIASSQKILAKQIIEEAINTISCSAALKKITITFSCEPEVKISGDRNILLSAIRNLLSNAIKFTRINGHITIDAKATNDCLEIAISDNGIGMDETTINNLFNLKNRVSLKGTAGEAGTGFGLILTKELINLHQGEIKVNSKLNEGSTFTLKLPIQESN